VKEYEQLVEGSLNYENLTVVCMRSGLLAISVYKIIHMNTYVKLLVIGQNLGYEKINGIDTMSRLYKLRSVMVF